MTRFTANLCIALIGILLFVMGCQVNTKPEKIEMQNILYFRDGRSGLCFAAINSYVSGTHITSITNVPCEAVKNLLDQ